MSALRLSVEFPPEVIDAIASRVVELLADNTADRRPVAGWLDVDQAAAYIAAKPQRIYDLKAAGRLRFAKDGSRLLFRREWLDAYLEGSA